MWLDSALLQQRASCELFRLHCIRIHSSEKRLDAAMTPAKKWADLESRNRCQEYPQSDNNRCQEIGVTGKKTNDFV
jgi:hypothetical protein